MTTDPPSFRNSDISECWEPKQRSEKFQERQQKKHVTTNFAHNSVRNDEAMLSNSEGKTFSNPEFCVQQNYHLSINEEQGQRFPACASSPRELLGLRPDERAYRLKRKAWGCGEEELPPACVQGTSGRAERAGWHVRTRHGWAEAPGRAPLTRWK